MGPINFKNEYTHIAGEKLEGENAVLGPGVLLRDVCLLLVGASGVVWTLFWDFW